MEQITEILIIASGVDVILAILAINLTVISLTSLADKKNILGIDYGKFLLDKYKIGNWLSIRFLLVIFGFINGFSIFRLVSNCLIFDVFILFLMLVALIFIMVYFFKYIMLENKNVIKQIYAQELIGIYLNGKVVDHFAVDKTCGMPGASSKKKRITNNLIVYFNTYDLETDDAFSMAFGPESVLYDAKMGHNVLLNRKLDEYPYFYATDQYKDKEFKKIVTLTDYGILNNYFDVIHGKFISFEFFLLFRYTELQDYWVLRIIDIFCGEDNNDHILMKLMNMGRTLSIIAVFGEQPSIYKYKFFEALDRGPLYDVIKGALAEYDTDEINDFIKNYILEPLYEMFEKSLSMDEHKLKIKTISKMKENLEKSLNNLN